MKFEWDADKDAENVGKHGVSFEMARVIFKDYILPEWTIAWITARHATQGRGK